MNKLKEGDTLICRKDVVDTISGDILFNIGLNYVIDYVGRLNIEVKDNKNDTWDFLTDETYPSYIYKTFITLADWREVQIDNILNDE